MLPAGTILRSVFNIVLVGYVHYTCHTQLQRKTIHGSNVIHIMTTLHGKLEHNFAILKAGK